MIHIPKIYNFFAALFLLLAVNSHAQKVKYDDDTVKVDGKPYAIMKKKSAGPMRNDFTVINLAGTELLFFKSGLRQWTGTGFMFGNEELYYEVYFTATGSQAQLKHYNGKGFAKLIVENNLVSGDEVDQEAEKRFIMLYHGYTPPKRSENTQTKQTPTPAVVVNINNNTGNAPQQNQSQNTPPPEPVKAKSPVTINGKQIIRDEKVIGKFRQDTTSSTYSQKTILITIYTEGGEKAAEASAVLANPQEWKIKVLADNKTYNILYDAPGERENLFKWLADKNFLSN